MTGGEAELEIGENPKLLLTEIPNGDVSAVHQNLRMRRLRLDLTKKSSYFLDIYIQALIALPIGVFGTFEFKGRVQCSKFGAKYLVHGTVLLKMRTMLPLLPRNIFLSKRFRHRK